VGGLDADRLYRYVATKLGTKEAGVSGWWFLVGMVLAGAAVVVAARWRVDEEGRARAADRFARQVDLALPSALLPVVAERLVRRRRAFLVTASLALVIWLAVATWAMRTGRDWGAGASPDLAVALLGTFALAQLARAGAALAAQAGDLARRGPDAPRAAHLPRPRLADYLSPLERWPARALAAAAVLVPLALAVTGPERRGPLLGLAAACLGMWALVELTVLAVVRGRPAATDPQSLAFDDALRADAARRLLGSLDVLPFVAALFVGRAGLWPTAWTALVVLYVAGVVGLPVLTERRSVKTHYRRRLWPAAGG
jgi:hypothetical protein